jgi:hypothetical protein
MSQISLYLLKSYVRNISPPSDDERNRSSSFDFKRNFRRGNLYFLLEYVKRKMGYPTDLTIHWVMKTHKDTDNLSRMA